MRRRLDPHLDGDSLQSVDDVLRIMDDWADEVTVDESRHKVDRERMRRVKDLLEGCVDTWLMNWLAHPPHGPLVRALPMSKFKSAHPPIGAMIKWPNLPPGPQIYVASWNLSGEDEAGHQEPPMEWIVQKILEILEHKVYPKIILCLQGCWPDLLKKLAEKFEKRKEDKRNEEKKKGVSKRIYEVWPCQQSAAEDSRFKNCLWLPFEALKCVGLLETAGHYLQSGHGYVCAGGHSGA